MMASNSLLRSFETLTTRLRSQNQRRDPADAPPVLLENPLLQLYVETARTILPAELARHLDRLASPQACLDWFGVAALYQQASGNPLEQGVFLEQVRTHRDPARIVAAVIAAKAAALVGPTSRNAIWQRLDWLGVALQGLVLGFLLCARALVMHLAALKWPHLWTCIASVLGRLVGSGDTLSSLMPVSRWAGVLWLLVMAGWLFFEYQIGPVLMEFFRQLPAGRRGLPLPPASREEALYWLWRVQCVATLMYLAVRWVAG